MASNLGYIKSEGQNWLNGALTLILITLLFFGCSPDKTGVSNQVFGKPSNITASTANDLSEQQQEIIQAQNDRVRRRQVTVTARVYRLLPDDVSGIPHQRFLLELVNGTTVLVAHDTKLAPVVPISAGDFVTLHGEYIFNEKGGVLHFTHKSTNWRHEGGWIDFNGVRYQ